MVNFFFECCRFRIDNTDHIIDVNHGNIPYEYDQVNLVCPSYSPSTPEDEAEKYIIYNVSLSPASFYFIHFDFFF